MVLVGGIGYFGLAYYAQYQQLVKGVEVVNPSTGECVAPSAASVEAGSYLPLARPIFIYVRADDLDERPEVEAFVKFYIEQAPSLVTEVGYVSVACRGVCLGSGQAGEPDNWVCVQGRSCGHNHQRGTGENTIVANVVAGSLRNRRLRQRMREAPILAFLFLCAFVSVVTTIGIVIVLLAEALAVLSGCLHCGVPHRDRVDARCFRSRTSVCFRSFLLRP